jgi:hypothetical protein
VYLFVDENNRRVVKAVWIDGGGFDGGNPQRVEAFFQELLGRYDFREEDGFRKNGAIQFDSIVISK